MRHRTERDHAQGLFILYQSFNEGDHQWLGDQDLGGNNDYTTTTRIQIARTLRACTHQRVIKARNRLNKSTDDRDESRGDKSSRDKHKQGGGKD